MPQDIRHLVVLMLENRSYDHLVGYLSQRLGGLDGLAAGMGNHAVPKDATSPFVAVSPAANDIIGKDPDHDFEGATLQLFGSTTAPVPPAATCDGFLASHVKTTGGSLAKGAEVMQCVAEHRIPALAHLAEHFAICDHWYSSVPGPTWPNRFFAHCATSGGFVVNKVTALPHHVLQPYTMPSIFEALHQHGASWNVFFHDFPQSLALTNLRQKPHRSGFKRIKRFYEAAEAGTLPAYSFIEPQYFNYLKWRANDQHGGHSISLGDTLVAHVYEALRGNEAAWPHTMLLIVHDEHGGFFDHVAPPYDGRTTPAGVERVTNPDGLNSATPPFDFKRLGVRVPAVVVSPFVPKGTKDHRTFEHASIPATVRAIAGITTPLNSRDASARPFHDIASLATMRTDTPVRLPQADDIDVAAEEALKRYEMDTSALFVTPPPAGTEDPPLSDLQQTLLDLADRVNGTEAAFTVPGPSGAVGEQQAAARVRLAADRLLDS